MIVEEEPFKWIIIAPWNVIYTAEEKEVVHKAVEAFRAQLPHHTLTAVRNVAVDKGNGVFGRDSWGH
jgi:hypothetical protein